MLPRTHAQVRTRRRGRAARVAMGAAIAIFASSAVGSTGLAQAGVEESRLEAEALHKQASLKGVVDAMERLTAELETRQAELESERARGRESAIVADIRRLVDELAELDRNFSQIATGVDPQGFDDEPKQRLDFSSELRDLLGPLVHELRRMTSRPREIDRLRSEISDATDQLVLIERALSNLERTREQTQDPRLLEELREETGEWEQRAQEARTKLTIARQKLDQKESERTSVTDTVRGVFQLFFKSRGRNLMLALAATVLFLLLLRRLHQEILRRRPTDRFVQGFRARLFSLLFAAFTAIGGVLVFLIVLYVFGDWVLLILVVMLLMGLIWASKQAIPAFWRQATLLLDMGPVREGERLVYRDIPFEVSALGFYTLLENPALTGGGIRLPIDDLTDLRSRPYDEREPWFPTREGDWILLANGSLGRVSHQNPETVRVEFRGGATQIHPAAEFAASAPVVLSGGFRIQVVFGVDYAHVEIATEEIANALRDFVARGLDASRTRDHVKRVQVEFASAGASSLDLAVLCDFEGEAAPEYDVLTRLVNRLCVDAANANGWVIPFQQITLHMAEPQSAD